ncbi:MAG: nucleotidyl transferase AbiEii/AbiGii toxin family protein [Candidatus Latescibacteria bacterium]|jgi:hypothetical protein|nr:nucleotidyl transferase AbiEii/AbiGii toxin family protein [Candidatus Latescibacterota bacterium]MBT4138493.1 nucleotidyl transferase AbiEii/AbiGii toxin family protein [Candidatus Latescibacterota bacterium]
MDSVALLPDSERNALFGETARMMSTTPAITEKDFWVVWVLGKLFGDARLKQILQFKGGTSLSKVFGLIGRFSEDIDLILDWREVTQEDPYRERSRTQQGLFNVATNEQAKVYIKTELLPAVSDLLGPLCMCHMEDSDGLSIFVRYPSAYADTYLRPEILLEIGPLASWTPSDTFRISPYAATHFPAVFSRPYCDVSAIVAKRTFWEKATILHQEAHRAADKSMPFRYSRHYYDLALLSRADVRQEALSDLDLLEEVVAFKQRFYPSAWALYELAKPGSFKLLPPDERLAELQRDYQAMQNMIFDKHLSLDEIIDNLSNLEDEINASD